MFGYEAINTGWQCVMQLGEYLVTGQSVTSYWAVNTSNVGLSR